MNEPRRARPPNLRMQRTGLWPAADPVRYADGVMKAALLSVLLMCVATVHGATPRFAIYLAAPELECQTPTPSPGRYRTSVSLEEIGLSAQPWITEESIVSFDAATATVTLRSDSKVRYPDPSVHGSVFVAQIDGKRAFAGAFWTVHSSFCSCTLPTITTEHNERFDAASGVARQFKIDGLFKNRKVTKVFRELGKLKE